MPLITPESSSSTARDDRVFILGPSAGASPERISSARGPPFFQISQGHKTDERQRDKIIILGPFAPQTMELTSSSDSSSRFHSQSQAMLEHQAAYSPIHVPIPRYEDCFQEPFDHALLFDPVEYESESPDYPMAEVVNECMYLTPPRTPVTVTVTDEETDHCTIVRARLKAVEKLLWEIPNVELGMNSTPRTPSPKPKASKRPRLSPIPSSGLPLPLPRGTSLDVGADPFLPRHLRPAEPIDKASYTIPQLRGLSIAEDLPPPPSVSDQSLCHACYGTAPCVSMMRVGPCHDIICARCFSAALGAVSEGHRLSRCPACLRVMTDFAKLDYRTKHAVAELQPAPPRSSSAVPDECSRPVVMRIDNVAWDLTPKVVQDFLPPGTLANVPVPIHIPLDRYDGRTKDYMYVEVASLEAARKILQSCQNAQMPGGPLTGGKKRAVTISQVHHSELLKEVSCPLSLRPHSSSELQALLALCQASVSDVQPPSNHSSSYVAPNGLAHFVKNRHGPFNALMSILSKVKGKDSPSYWDLFQVTAGAIAALGSHISRHTDPIILDSTDADPDQTVLDKLKGMFKTTFGMVCEAGRLSPA